MVLTRSNVIEQVDPKLLKPHPVNTRIYGKTEDVSDLVTSIRDIGIQQPIHAKVDNTIISGHRRWQASLQCEKITDVPVIRVSFASELDEREALLEHNRYRQKNGFQLHQEGLEREAIYAERAEIAMLEGAKLGGETAGNGRQKESSPEVILPQGYSPEDKADSEEEPKLERTTFTVPNCQSPSVDCDFSTGGMCLGCGKTKSSDESTNGRKDGATMLQEGLDREKVYSERAQLKSATQVETKAEPKPKRQPQTREKVSTDLNLGSARQWDKLKEIGRLAEEGNILAQELLPKINNGVSLTGAYTQICRNEKSKNLADVPPPSGLYRCIVADPPWPEIIKTGTGDRSKAEKEYPTMGLDAIKGLGETFIQDIADTNSHLFLWATNFTLPYAFEVMKAWGFEYRTMLTWGKENIGLGYYFRGQTEHVLFGTKGTAPLQVHDIGTLFTGEKTQHSSKPDTFFSIVEKASYRPYIELFARKPREGWSVWGNESEGNDA